MIKKLLGTLSARPRLRILLLAVIVIVILVVLMEILSSSQSSTGPSAPPSSFTNPNVHLNQVRKGAASEQYEALAKKEAAQHPKPKAMNQSEFSNIFAQAEKQASGKKKPEQKKTKQSVKKQPVVQRRQPEQPRVNPAKQEVNPEAFAKQVLSRDSGGAPRRSEYHANSNRSFNNYAAGNYGANASRGNTVAAQASRNQYISTLAQQMQKSLQGAAKSWSFPTQTTVVGQAASQPQGIVAKPQTVVIKAGTIMFAVLDTALNSDQPGTPVLATIVSGKYRGAKLMGAFKMEGEKLVITFGLMSMKSKMRTIGIEAYAIDATTGHNALVSSVNHHYLLRYGSLFAAAFLEGFGNAYATAQTPSCPPGTQNCTIIGSQEQRQATTKTAMYQGLGKIGTNLGQEVGQEFNTPPTVIVNQGIGMGILFMKDVSM